MVYTIYVKEYSSDQIYTFLGDTIDHSFDECPAPRGKPTGDAVAPSRRFRARRQDYLFQAL